MEQISWPVILQNLCSKNKISLFSHKHGFIKNASGMGAITFGVLSVCSNAARLFLNVTFMNGEF